MCFCTIDILLSDLKCHLKRGKHFFYVCVWIVQGVGFFFIHCHGKANNFKPKIPTFITLAFYKCQWALSVSRFLLLWIIYKIWKNQLGQGLNKTECCFFFCDRTWKMKKNSASADGGPRSRVCPRETLRSSPIQTSRNFLAHKSGGGEIVWQFFWSTFSPNQRILSTFHFFKKKLNFFWGVKLSKKNSDQFFRQIREF